MKRTGSYKSNLNLLALLLSVSLIIGCSATGKMIKRGDEALARKDFFAAAQEYLEVLQTKPKHGKALTKLSNVAKPAYEQKLNLAKGYREQDNLKAALAEYKQLDRFIGQLKRYNALNFVTVNVAKEIEMVSAGAAEKHYKRAEAAFKSGKFESAITQYKEAVKLTNPYKDCREKIATSYYQIASGLEKAGQFRRAAVNYRSALDHVKQFKDATDRAASLYYHLGDYFLSQRHCRKAYEDFVNVQRIDSQYENLTEMLHKSKECATVKIAFVEFDNPTGKNLAGMALGDFIFETIKTKVQAGASQFIRILDREQLHVLASEQQISAGVLGRESSLVTKLEGVHYLIFGKINQVSDVHVGLSKTPMRTTYDYWYEVPYTDSKGKRRAKTQWAKGDLYYSLYNDKRTVKLAGAIRGGRGQNRRSDHQPSNRRNRRWIKFPMTITSEQPMTSLHTSYPSAMKSKTSQRPEMSFAMG